MIEALCCILILCWLQTQAIWIWITVLIWVYVHAKLLQLYLTLCNPMDYNLQAPLFMGFSRQEYWRGLPCPSPGDLPNPGVEPMCLMSPALAGRFFTTSATWEISNCVIQANTVLNLPQLNSSSLQEWQKSAINLLLNSDYHMVYERLKEKRCLLIFHKGLHNGLDFRLFLLQEIFWTL